MPRFKLQHKVIPLELRHTFTIARGSKSVVNNVFVKLTAGGVSGWGEAAPNKRYDETAETVAAFVEKVRPAFEEGRIDSEGALLQTLDAVKLPDYSAMAALETAWLDWQAKREGLSLAAKWSLSGRKTPPTTYTIGIDTEAVIRQKLKEAAEYPLLKVKLGTDRDREIIRLIRSETDKPIRVDINEGWGSVEQARSELDFLAQQGVELVEQPLPAAMVEEMKQLKKLSPLPLCADESFIGFESLEEIAQGFDAINIKLMKIGSLLKAREVIREARRQGLKIMIGCMIESSLADAASALLALQADYADLDGHLLIRKDPFEGLLIDTEKRLSTSGSPGLGVEPSGWQAF